MDWRHRRKIQKALMKIQFNMQIQSVGKHIISFRDCDMTTAREFISLLINFMIENEIYSGEPLYLLNDDIEKYIYACLINKKMLCMWQSCSITSC